MNIHFHYHAVKKIWLFSSQVAQQPKFRILSMWQFHCPQPDSIESQIHFKLAVQTEWASTFLTMLLAILFSDGTWRDNFIARFHFQFKLAVQIEWTHPPFITMLLGRAGYFILRWHGSLIIMRQFHRFQPDSYNLKFISNLQYKLSEHPPSSPYCEEGVAILFSGGAAAQHTF